MICRFDFILHSSQMILIRFEKGCWEKINFIYPDQLSVS